MGVEQWVGYRCLRGLVGEESLWLFEASPGLVLLVGCVGGLCLIIQGARGVV